MNIEFDDKTIVVVGANRGIGYQVAKAFAESGGNVTIMAESEDIHAAAVKMSEETGKSIVGKLCDITDINSLQNAFGDIDSVDILVCNSGVGLRGPLSVPMEEVAENYRRAINVNVFGALMLTHIAAEKVQRGGHIIYTASTYSKAPQGDFVAYAATKHATLGIVRATAKELGPAGITVNAVCPGPIHNELLEMAAERTGTTPADYFADLTKQQAINRGPIQMSDLVGAYLFLASDAAAQITGQAINVDKGEVMM